MVSLLPDQAVEILLEMKNYKNAELVFPSTARIDRPLSENTLNQALRRMGFENNEQTSQGFRAIA